MSFASLGLSNELLRAVSDQNYLQPTFIQAQAIPAILQGRDIMAAAQTGTGKTAGFTLPLLQRLSLSAAEKRRAPRSVRALILTPTRELAAQVNESVRTYGKHLPLKSAVIFGGVKIYPQISQLRHGVDILIATPGRLLDLINQKAVELSALEILVLDEADRMLDMGFIHDIRRILKLVPRECQNLLFSATFSSEIKELIGKLLRSPVVIEEERTEVTPSSISQTVYLVDRNRKRELLSWMIGSNNWKQVLVFTRTKHGANRLADQLNSDGLPSAAIHGGKTQGARTRALANFKQGKVRVLVATDIAARGLDINKLPHVVNFDLPLVAEDYIHRIGRTGRAENQGAAISLVCVDEHGLLRNIEKLLKCKVPQLMMPGYEPDASIKAQPIPEMRGGQRRSDNAGNRRKSGSRFQRGSRSDSRSRSREEGSANDSASPFERRRRPDSSRRKFASEGAPGRHYRDRSDADFRPRSDARGEEGQRGRAHYRDRSDADFRPRSDVVRGEEGQRERRVHFERRRRPDDSRRKFASASAQEGGYRSRSESGSRSDDHSRPRRGSSYGDQASRFEDRRRSSDNTQQAGHRGRSESDSRTRSDTRGETLHRDSASPFDKRKSGGPHKKRFFSRDAGRKKTFRR